MPVESVVTGRNSDLIAAAAELWIKPHYLVVDTTFGNGRWWTKYQHPPENFIAHDLDTSKGDGVDFRALPEEDSTVDVVIFDPPYISVGGRETSNIKGMLQDYGLLLAPKTPAGVDELVAEGMAEAARVLRPGGLLFLKVADYISSGKFHAAHNIAVNNALFDGYFKVADEFIHFSGTGPQPTVNLDGSPRRQVHSRRAHSFLVIFQRTKVR